jgi:hypothetical protein
MNVLDLLIIIQVSAELSFYTYISVRVYKTKNLQTFNFLHHRINNLFCYRYGRSYSSHIDVYVSTCYDPNDHS